eukprot:SAG22_NODE_15224_length_354_cov_0.611765_1_plen_93_part_01
MVSFGDPRLVAVVAIGFAMSKMSMFESAGATMGIRVCFLLINVLNMLAHIWFYRLAAAIPDDSAEPPVLLRGGRSLSVKDHDKAAALLQIRSG